MSETESGVDELVDAATRLEEKEYALEHVLLDPNNPRLLGRNQYTGVPEGRIGEPLVQRGTMQKLEDGPFDMESLRGSIEAQGLLLVDRIVVRPYDEERVVVVEGNRRIAACKSLLGQHERAERTLPEHVLDSIKRPKVLLLPEQNAERARLDQWVIQGIRHISGIRPWGAFQAAKTMEAMLSGLGYTEDQVQSALSIPKSRIRRSMKVLACLDQMAEDDEYSSFSGPDLYGYFDEIVKRPKIRTWLGWSDDSNRFENLDRVQMLYSWIVPDEELPNNERRLPASSSIRDLDEIIDDPVALGVLSTPGKTLQDAQLALAPTREPEWREPVRRATKALEALPINVLETLQPVDEALIEGLITLGSKRLAYAHALAAEASSETRQST